ncbi:MAG: hypothetical protein GMKNLPBB_00012 [Myxococcota bacterium]|nr:hypothetical protein [Myxococcota bacterium]
MKRNFWTYGWMILGAIAALNACSDDGATGDAGGGAGGGNDAGAADTGGGGPKTGQNVDGVSSCTDIGKRELEAAAKLDLKYSLAPTCGTGGANSIKITSLTGTSVIIAPGEIYFVEGEFNSSASHDVFFGGNGDDPVICRAKLEAGSGKFKAAAKIVTYKDDSNQLVIGLVPRGAAELPERGAPYRCLINVQKN